MLFSLFFKKLYFYSLRLTFFFSPHIAPAANSRFRAVPVFEEVCLPLRVAFTYGVDLLDFPDLVLVEQHTVVPVEVREGDAHFPLLRFAHDFGSFHLRVRPDHRRQVVTADPALSEGTRGDGVVCQTQQVKNKVKKAF